MSWKRPNIGSRVNREVHARFWERAEVKFLRATRQTRQIDRPMTLVSCPLRADRYRNSAPQRIDVVCQQRSCDLAPAYLALYDPTLHTVLHRWRLCVRRLTLSGACAIALFISLLTSPQYAIAQSPAGQQIPLV